MSRFTVLLLTCFGLFSAFATAEEVNVYSARKEALIKPLLDRFTDQTGIEVNLVTGKADALLTRMQSEGQFSPVDVLITTDAGRLVRAKQMQLTQAIPGEADLSAVATRFVDPERHWTALTLRARTIMVAPERVEASHLKSWQDLTKPEFKGRVCIRSSNNIYNQSLVAALMEQWGEAKTLAWAKGLVANFARPPAGGDRDQIKAVVAGQCDIAIANTYYLAGMLESSDAETREIAQQVQVLWPNQNDQGVHVNVSGAAIAKHAKNTAAATRLIQFMLTNDSQSWYANTNGEYPVINGVKWSDTLQQMGDFKMESVSLQQVGERNAEALKLMDAAGWK